MTRIPVGAILALTLLALPLAVEAQPALEQFRFDPPQLCLRDTFQWGFSYRGIPGGLATVKDVEVGALWEGRPVRSPLSPTKDELLRHTADQGRFESYRLHWPRPGPAGGGEFRYSLRVVLADGQELTSATSLRYLDACPPPALHTTLAAGPTGRIGFQTTTPTIPEFLQGVRPAATSLIWGDLELPPGRVERSPAVVLVHGSSGVALHVDRWAEELRRIGAATFILDWFTGRGITGTVEDQAQINHLAPIGDAYRALELLATHPRIDPARITLLGFSRGGTVALWSALTRFQRLHGPAGARFAHHIAFYPGCYFTYVDDEAVTDGPIRIFHGTADDYTPIEPCRAYVERLRRAGKDAQLTEYPGAHHAFDRASTAPPLLIAGAQTARHCFWEERPEGHLVNRDSGLPFSVTDPCIVRGTTIGPDPAAYQQAMQAVKALVGTAARPSP